VNAVKLKWFVEIDSCSRHGNFVSSHGVFQKRFKIVIFCIYKKSETITAEIIGVSHNQVALFKTFRGTTKVCAR